MTFGDGFRSGGTARQAVVNELDEISDVSRRTVGRLRQCRGGGMGLRMAPMIDIIFLLLTFFVLTVRFRVPEQFLPITLPSAVQAREIGIVEPLVINILADESDCVVQFGESASAGEVVIRAGEIDGDLANLYSEVVAVLKSQKRHVGDPIEVVCSDDVKWDYLVKIYNVLYAMGINDITFAMTE